MFDNKKELRPYQRKCLDKLLAIFNKKTDGGAKRAFLQMPPGTGKTFSALSFCLEVLPKNKPVTVVWTAHQTNLIAQSYRDFMRDFFGQEFGSDLPPKLTCKIDDRITFIFTTWQALRQTKNNIDLLIIDECHYGSSLSHGQETRDHKSFKKIMKLANQHLYVSATPWNLNTSLFPGLMTAAGEVKEEFIAEYTLQDAANDGMICDVYFNCIKSITTLELKREYEKRQKEFEEYDEGIDFVKEHEVDIKSDLNLRKLETAALESALDAIFAQETVNGKLKPLLVYCKNRNSGFSLARVQKMIRQKAVQYFGGKVHVGKSFVETVSGEDAESIAKIDKFKNGEINVLCAVRMFREGTDYPALSVQLDLDSSFHKRVEQRNNRDIIQKVGRLTRIFEGKPLAKYYYLDLFENHFYQGGVKKEFTAKADSLVKEVIQSAYTRKIDIPQDDLDSAKNAVRATKETQDELFGKQTAREIPLKQTTIMPDKAIKRKHKVTVSTTGFVISEAYNKNPLKGIKRDSLYACLQTVPGNQINWNKLAVSDLIKIAKGEMYL